MQKQDFSVSFAVERSPAEVFAAITNVRGWWSGVIEGETARLGAVFTYRYRNRHISRQRATELVPGKRVVWHVDESHISFLTDKDEWTGTDIVFDVVPRGHETEVRFTHIGIRPDVECYGACSSGWSKLVGDNLRNLILTGAPQPDVFA